MPRVFIIGAMLPTGGAYMAYHLGKLLHLHFGYELYNVAIFRAERRNFEYDPVPATVSAIDMERMIGPDDLMVVNPSFSQFLFGWRLPGRKIMYAQDFRTFMLLDCHCDLYVSVSPTVQRYIEGVYGLRTEVIPPFIRLDSLPPATPWRDRPENSALVYIKNPSNEHRILYEELKKKLRDTAPQIDLTQMLEGRGLSHRDFLEKLGAVRYVVNLSLAEGFGLVPLEAMAMGACLTGVDGLAGGDYLHPGKDSLVGSIKNLRPLPDIMMKAFTDETLAEACAREGQKTARAYGYEPFKKAWLSQFEKLLGRAAQHA